jgi:transposase
MKTPDSQSQLEQLRAEHQALQAEKVQLEAQAQALLREKARLEAQLALKEGLEGQLREALLEIAELKRQLFGHGSEQLTQEEEGQLAEVAGDLEEQAQREPPLSREVLEDQDQERPQGERQRRRRHPLPEHLERQTVVPQPESLSPCEQCGAVPERIGEEVSEELEYVPAKLIVQRTVRPKYACRCGCAGVQVALLPTRLLPQRKLGVGLAVYVLLARFDDHIAYYTLEPQISSGAQGWRSACDQFYRKVPQALCDRASSPGPDA